MWKNIKQIIRIRKDLEMLAWHLGKVRQAFLNYLSPGIDWGYFTENFQGIKTLFMILRIILVTPKYYLQLHLHTIKG